jgi:transcriptional regulator with XRE-family HTH domain
LATLIGSTQPTVQSIELGRLPLSKRFAYLIAEQTGLTPEWLLANKLGDPPPDPDSLRQRYDDAQVGAFKGIYAAHLAPRLIVLRFVVLWLAVVNELGYTGSRAAGVFKLLQKTNLEVFDAIADSKERKRIWKTANQIALDERQMLRFLSSNIAELQKYLREKSRLEEAARQIAGSDEQQVMKLLATKTAELREYIRKKSKSPSTPSQRRSLEALARISPG